MGKVNPFIVIDFETGGLQGNKNPITEVAMLCVDGHTMEEIGRYDSYVKPYLGYEYDPKALDYTNLTLEKLTKEGKDLEVVVREIVEKVKEWHQKTTNTHTKKPILVGHNVQFDISFLQQIFKETKNDLSKYFNGKLDFFGKFYPDYQDTQTLAKFAYGWDDNFNSFKLGNCIQRAGQTLTDAHKAINDVIGTKELLIHFVNKLREEGDIKGSNKVRFREKFRFQF